MKTETNWAIIRHFLYNGEVIVDFYSGHLEYVGCVDYSSWDHHDHFESVEAAEAAIAAWSVNK